MSNKLTQQGFISEEQKTWAVKTLQSDRKGEFAPAGATGCNLDYLKHRTTIRFSTANIYPAMDHGLFPESADLTAGINPLIFNQNPRGTCVAQATAALAQYYFGNNILLSAEYVFALHKQYQCNHYEAAWEKFKARVIAPYLKSEKSFEVVIPDDLINQNTDEFEQIELTGMCQCFTAYLQNIKDELDNIKSVETILSDKKLSPADKQIACDNFEKSFNKVNHPANSDGSNLAWNLRIFADTGFASFESWPYNQAVIAGNSGHLPIPERCFADAEKRKIKDKLYLFPDPTNVDEIKRFLTGNHGQWRPMPVAVSIPCFDSWCNSPFTRRTGWLNMPQPDEYHVVLQALKQAKAAQKVDILEKIADRTSKHEALHLALQDDEIKEFLEANKEYIELIRDALRNSPEYAEKRNGGHAMLIVGYKDEPLSPGGGYFLVRNSWGKEHGWESKNPGHVKIPYQYIRNCNEEAFSIIQETGEKQQASAPEKVENSKTTTVETTPAAAKAESCQTTAAAAVVDGTSLEKIELFAQAKDVCKVFTHGVEQNICDNVRGGTFFLPDIDLPGTYKFLPWQISVNDLERSQDNTEEFINRMIANKIIPAELKTAANEITNFSLKVLKSGKLLFPVFSGFISGIAGNKVIEPQPEQIHLFCSYAQEMLEQLADVAERGHKICGYACIIGSLLPVSETVSSKYQGTDTSFVLYCSNPDNRWNYQMPLGKDGQVWRQFIINLLPESREQLAGILKEKLRDALLIPDSSKVSLTEDKVKVMFDRPEIIFDTALNTLIAHGEFRRVKEKGQQVLAPGKESIFKRYHMLGGKVVFALDLFQSFLGPVLGTIILYYCVGRILRIQQVRYSPTTAAALGTGAALLTLVFKILKAWAARKIH